MQDVHVHWVYTVHLHVHVDLHVHVHVVMYVVDLHVHVDQRVWVDLHVRTYIIMHVRCSDTVDLPVHVHYIEFIYTCVMNIHVHIFRRSRCTCTCGMFTIQIDAKSFIWRKQLFFYISTFMLHVILNAKNAYNMVLTRKPKITGFFISTFYKL